ncbi:uncharacterized protein LOC132870186 [Neoarius graeffei]|uniref:uncharacterized protein LOC132870186 n=1 Tax=Neoarius graeffei TaxID=443677 RepID=UPI00298D0800|nr:uncharacterized protein LOC132870186 [Neoarius graeffei]
MVCAHMLTKFPFLFLLSFGVSHVENKDLDQNTLVSVIQFFHKNYDPDSQYAIAINVPKEQCAGYVDNNFLTKYPADNVKNGMNSDDRLYTADELIAARPKKKKKFNIHSESILLRIPDSQGMVPMKRLLDRYSSGCVVFYTYNSPCVQTCTDPVGNYSILPALQQLFQNYNGPKAFVFTDIFRNDTQKPQFAEQLKLVDDRIPLYRCIKGKQGQITECFVCRDSNRDIVEKCLK